MAINLNYNHLYYFWMVAKEGNLTRAANRLLIAQSALSSQIKKLEYQLGKSLFEKEGRGLALTEAGMIAFNYAEKIFQMGNELDNLFKHQLDAANTVLKIGVISSLSRNFVENFIKPVLKRADVQIQLISGSEIALLPQLDDHRLDLILSNSLQNIQQQVLYRIKPIAKQQVSIVGKPLPAGKTFNLKEDLPRYRLLLPGLGNELRSRFDQLCEAQQIQYQIMGEVNDMPALRLLARDSDGVALLPTVVVQDEIKAGILQEYCKLPDVFERFYAISLKKQFEPEIVKFLLAREEDLTQRVD
jgi:LysR family transcriptional activator of nhaA